MIARGDAQTQCWTHRFVLDDSLQAANPDRAKSQRSSVFPRCGTVQNRSRFTHRQDIIGRVSNCTDLKMKHCRNSVSVCTSLWSLCSPGEVFLSALTGLGGESRGVAFSFNAERCVLPFPETPLLAHNALLPLGVTAEK